MSLPSLFLVVLVLLSAAPSLTRAQEWNGARALDLMDRARVRRAEPLADSLLRNYQATARGVVYFYLDRRDSQERTLVKTDQLALEVLWAAPDRTRQRIVGWRDESRLPNRMRYHVDHLTVVQNEFGDAIRLGEGDEVRDVPHPAAPGADSIYDFRLADSLTIVLPGAPQPVRAYEIEVRPKRPDRSAFVGSVFVDRTSADIVRMTFTFTPASYIDRRLDYISISLDNALWEGRYWLPHEQHVEIRRQIPELDFVAGAVIQARFHVSDYVFNQDLPPGTFLGPPVIAVPRAQREAFPFERDLYEDLDAAGLAPPPDLNEVRIRAAEMLRQRTLSGLPRLRLALGGASGAFRFNRAEEVFAGAGASYRPERGVRGTLTAGFATGPEHVAVRLGLGARLNPGLELSADAFLNETRDVGVRPGAPPALNTLSSLTFGDDFLDAFYASGGRIRLTRALGAGARGSLGFSIEKHRTARLSRSGSPFGGEFRAVRPVDEGWLASVRLGLDRDAAAVTGWTSGIHARALAGSFDGHGLVRAEADATLLYNSGDRDAELRLRTAAGIAAAANAPPREGALPSQLYFVLGGRETLPGYPYRAYAGDVFLLADVAYGHDLVWPWFRLRLLGAAGWSDRLRDPDPAAMDALTRSPFLDWGLEHTRGIRASAGAGIGLFFDVLRIDAARGLRGGEWQLILSVQPDLWTVL